MTRGHSHYRDESGRGPDPQGSKSGQRNETERRKEMSVTYANKFKVMVTQEL